MKKWNTRLIVITFLALASIVSYTYLNQASTQQQSNPLYTPFQEEEEMKEHEIFLPDVELINKAIEAGRRLSAYGA